MDTSTNRSGTSGVLRRAGAFLVAHAREFAALTVVLTFLLVLLGEFTAAAGAGATCNNTYPGCAGHLSPIGLSVPQFIEWFHRLVAMLTGYLIVGNGILLWWRHRGTRTSRAAWLATVLLPLQVLFGGFTVTLAGLLPGGYSPPVQLTHFTTALAIYTALLVSLVWVDVADGRGATRRRLRTVALVGLALPVLQAVFARGFLLTFWPSVQTGYHLFGLLGFAAFVAVVLWARELGHIDAAILGTVGALVTLVNAFLVIGVFVITARVEAVTYLLLFVQFLLFGGLAWVTSRSSAGASTGAGHDSPPRAPADRAHEDEPVQ